MQIENVFTTNCSTDRHISRVGLYIVLVAQIFVCFPKKKKCLKKPLETIRHRTAMVKIMIKNDLLLLLGIQYHKAQEKS